MTPHRVGFPGLTAMPWNFTSPMPSTASSITSRSPTELPPERTMMSQASASRRVRRTSSSVSFMMGNSLGIPPLSWTRAESV